MKRRIIKIFLISLVLAFIFHPKPTCLSIVQLQCSSYAFSFIHYIFDTISVSQYSVIYGRYLSFVELGLLQPLLFDLSLVFLIAFSTTLAYIQALKLKILSKIIKSRVKKTLLYLFIFLVLIILVAIPYYRNGYTWNFKTIYFRPELGGFVDIFPL